MRQPADSRFLASIFLSAFLLFQVEPILGRYVLPWFGGGPAVWTTCLLFFQTLLLLGYAYAHWLDSLSNTRVQSRIHVALLTASLLALPLDPRGMLSRYASSEHPSAHILFVLAAASGAPYLALSATGPLLQRWFTLVRPGEPPWRLYSLSNAGSFLALLTYPFAVEPFLKLRTQSWIWSALYAGFVALCAWTAISVPASARSKPGRELESAAGATRVLFWVVLAAAGSTLLLATTNLICQDVAVIPFLWIAPLALYLLTFVLAFERDAWYRRPAYAIAAGVLVCLACIVTAAAVAVPPWVQLIVYLAALFVTCMICHGELAQSRPAEQRLTAYYLAIAGGGAAGGIFVAIVAPRVFRSFSEYPAGLGAACACGLLAWIGKGAFRHWTSRNFGVRVPMIALLVGVVTPVALLASGGHPVLATVRNFFGILRVSQDSDQRNGPYRVLTHGRIRHGFQFLNWPQLTWPTTYYGPHSGVGIALENMTGPRRVGVIGLGAGTMAAWGRPADSFRFYEINPAVISIANTWFSYLRNSRAHTETVLGDARVQLERERAAGELQRFDLLAVDAFSSDAIPLHLLTAECGDLYRQHLAPGGLLLFHISNRFLELDPVTRGLASHLGWSAARFVSNGDEATGESSARWVLMTSNTSFLTRPEVERHVSPWTARDPGPILWTDDFASIWHVLKF